MTRKLQYNDEAEQVQLHTDIQVNITSGSAWIVADGEDYILQAGDRMVIPQSKQTTIVASISFQPLIYELVQVNDYQTSSRLNRVQKPSSLLLQAVTEDSNLESDWLWYAERVTGEAERRYCLERALYINPYNHLTNLQLTQLMRRPTAKSIQQPQRWFSRTARKFEA